MSYDRKGVSSIYIGTYYDMNIINETKGNNCSIRRLIIFAVRNFQMFAAEVPQYDPDFEGPRRDRSCTDVFWLLLFIIFLGLWAVVGIYGKYRLLIII